MASESKKLSFAKVAASSPKDKIAVGSAARQSAPPKQLPHLTTVTSPPKPVSDTIENGAAKPAPIIATSTIVSSKPTHTLENKVGDGTGDLSVDAKTPSLVVNGSGSTSTERSSKTGTSDDVSQKADSNSELGTKPPSLDGKSITSGTTFALDEKESLRPDDSASVKAAAEDDDAFSVRGSLIAGSRMGSEVAARVHRLQIGDMPPRTITTHVLPEHQVAGVVTPQSGASEQPPSGPGPLVAVANPNALTGLYSQAPDEKLLEAMQSPKDRLFLLRLEKDVVEFVQDSKEPFMDLPPSNSFCRMLTHKLADYYHMTHSFEAVAGAVRIYRTPFCRVPPPLASMVPSASNGSTPPPAILPKKIMRRGEDGETAPPSASPSKATSEAGSELKEKTAPIKEKLTREEREEAYNRARQRIFGCSEKTETSIPGDDSNDVSRASSVSGKDKASASKRKPSRVRRDDSESFEPRSQFVPHFSHSQHPTWVAPQYAPLANGQFGGQAQQPYTNTMPPVYAPPNQPFTPVAPGNGYGAYGNIPTYPSQPAQPRYTGQNAPMPYGSPMQSSLMPSQPQQNWQPPPPPPPPPQPSSQNFNQSYSPQRGPTSIPYPFGQLPANLNPNDPKSQHPIPGSYIRHGFNPKTQSFVPGTGMAPVQPPQGPYSGPHHVSPQLAPALMSYAGYQQPMGQPQFGVSPAAGFGMVRQGSNTSLPPYHAPPPQHQPQHQPHMSQQQQQQQLPPQQAHHGPPHNGPSHLPQNPSPHIPNKPVAPRGPSIGGQTFSHLPQYGNPATLPQKPTT